MKHIVLAAVLAALAFPVRAADPVEIAKPACDPKPQFPGRLAMQSDNQRKQFQRDMEKYKECMVGYTAQANTEAANAAVDEFNTTMKKINADIAAAQDMQKDLTQ